MRRPDFADLCADVRGTTAVEFGILAPFLMLLLVGAVCISLALFLIGSLHYAVEEGARCASVKTTVCSDAPTTVAYAQQQYFGPTPAPTFTYATAACGNLVSASVSYPINLGITRVTVPVSASACFP